MANILITGGAGFIGSHTADALVRLGHSVRVLDLLDPQIHGPDADWPEYANPEVHYVRGDVQDLDLVQEVLDGIDAVYHFAALTGVGQSMYELRNYVDTNCTGTATLLEALIKRRRPLRRLILASSRAVYGEGTHACAVCGPVYPLPRPPADLEAGRFAAYCPNCGVSVRAVPTREDRPLLPLSMYGWTKLQQEEQCRFVAQTFGLPVVNLRYFNVYGSRQSLKNPYTGVVSIFYSRLLAGQPISLYEHGLPSRDFVHVSDVVRANVLALDAEVGAGACTNVGTGQAVTIRTVAETLARACGIIPSFIDRGEFRRGDIHACHADLERARQALGYASRCRLEDGLAEFVAWAGGQESVDLYGQTVAELREHRLFGHGSRELSTA